MNSTDIATGYHKIFIENIKKIATCPIYEDALKQFYFHGDMLDYDTVDNHELVECICTHDIHIIFTVIHLPTQKEYKIGSDCIAHFKNDKWNLMVKERLKLYKKYKNNYYDTKGQTIMKVGKCKGMKWEVIRKSEPQYCSWILEQTSLTNQHLKMFWKYLNDMKVIEGMLKPRKIISEENIEMPKKEFKNLDLDKCPQCKGNMKKGADICSSCKWVKCKGCEKYIAKAKGYSVCWDCYQKKKREVEDSDSESE